MAERKPVVLVGGVLKEMPSGDALPAANIPEVTAPNIHAATSKATPVDADELGLSDSAASWGLKKLTFANLKAWIGSLFVSKSGDTMTGPLAQAAGTAALPSYTFSGDVNTGVWSPAADVFAVSTGGAERLRIDTSGNVGIGTTASAFVKLAVNGTIKIGTGTAVEPGVIFSNTNWGMLFQAFQASPAIGDFGFANSAGVERMRIDPSGNVFVTGGGGLGYGVGSGGTASQPGQNGNNQAKGLSVTLNKPYGAITMGNAALGAGATVNFLLNNTLIGLNDSVLVVVKSGIVSAVYQAWCAGIAGGLCEISVRNNSGASASDAVVLHFAVIKGATS